MDKYINRDDYLYAKGIDLSLELHNDDNKSNKVERFIKQITDWCIEYLVINFNDNACLLGNFNNLSETRQTWFRKGVIEQIDYILRNGLLNIDSGYNSESNIIVDLSKLYLAPNAIQKFKMGGFANIRATKPLNRS